MSLIDQVASNPTSTETSSPIESSGSQVASQESSQPNVNGVPIESTQAVATPQGEGRMEEPWYWDEDIKGSTAKPDWLNTAKYKTVADQAKAYNEAQKKLGAFKGAPQEYDLSLPDFPDVKFDSNSPYMADFLESAKKNNVSQEYVREMLTHYVKMQFANKPDPKKELEKLGPNAAQDIKSLENWARNNLSDNEIGVFKDMITSADAVRVFEKIRRLVNRADTTPASNSLPRENIQDVRQMIHDPRYNTDESFRNKVRERLAQLSGE